MATIQIPGKTGQVRYIKCYKCGQPAAPENEVWPEVQDISGWTKELLEWADKPLFVWCQCCVPSLNQPAYWELKLGFGSSPEKNHHP